jgi:hypothetical protein
MGHRLQVLIPPDLDSQIEKAAQRNRVLKESLRRGGSGSETNPVERMAALGCPAGDIDQFLAEIDEGRR